MSLILIACIDTGGSAAADVEEQRICHGSVLGEGEPQLSETSKNVHQSTIGPGPIHQPQLAAEGNIICSSQKIFQCFSV